MKFANALKIESVPEWRNQYIDYKGLKKVLRLIDRAHLTQQEEHAYNYGSFFRRASNNSQNVPQRYPELPPPTYKEGTAAPEGDQATSNNHRTFSLTSLSEVARPLLNRMSARMVSLAKRGSYAGAPVYHPDDPHNNITLETLLDQVNEHERKFFVKLDAELRKIDTFYLSKEKETDTNIGILKRQLQEMKDVRRLKRRKKPTRRETLSTFVKQGLDYITMAAEQPRSQSESKAVRQTIDYKTSRRKLKKAIFEFYRGVELLQKYRALNKSGFVKILKKFDKVAKWTGSAVYMPKVEQAQFVGSKKLDVIIKETENLYVENFEAGMRRQAMAKLRLPNTSHKTHHAVVWRVGMYMGISIVLLVHGIRLVFAKQQESEVMTPILMLYGGFLLPLLLALLFGMNMYVWVHSHINYKFVFELDPRDNLDYREYFELPSIILLLLSTAFYLTFLTSLGRSLFPMLFVIGLLALFFCPFPIFYYEARRWLIVAIVRLFVSGFVGVEFRDFFIADELNSLTYSFMNISLVGCIFTVENPGGIDQACDISTKWFPVGLAILPPWWRLLQCLRRCKDTGKMYPHMLNAGKYLSTIAAITLAAASRILVNKGVDASSIKGIWIFVQIISSIYTSWWDIFMDWSLFQRVNDDNEVNDNTAEARFQLRKDLGFKQKGIYYFAIASNTFLRFAWALLLLYLHHNDKIILFVVALAEMCRRWQWNMFRVEYEHINNCGVYRAVKDISLLLEVFPEDKSSAKDTTPNTNRQSISQWLWTFLPAVRTAEARDFESRQDTTNPTGMIFFSDDEEDEEDEDDDGDYYSHWTMQNEENKDSVEEIELADHTNGMQRDQQNGNSSHSWQTETNTSQNNVTGVSTVASFQSSSPSAIARRRPTSLEAPSPDDDKTDSYVVVTDNNDYNSRRLMLADQEPPSLPPTP